MKIPSKKTIVIIILIIGLAVGGYFLYSFFKSNKKTIAISSLSLLNNISKFLPIQEDAKKEIDVLDKLVEAFTQNDNAEKTFLVMLQNEAELRPGGGFLGQYAIIKIKNGNVVSTFVEDANLLDQRIQTKINPPFPFERMMQIKKWKLRDSNFSPDFPTNAEKAKYFFRLAGGNSKQFDGVIAVNSQVLNDILELTGPITVPGYSGEFNNQNASRKLEEIVEKAYIMDPKLDTQNRKAILKKMSSIIMQKLLKLENVKKIAELFHEEMKNRNMMLNFSDPNLQQLVASVFWDGAIAKDWGGDYLMAVDANMGALKTDYYIRREIDYTVDFTQAKPTATLNIKYKNTAPGGDWRTSDYHAYLRVYVPKGSTFVSNHMVSHLNTAEDFNKTYFGFKVDVVMGREVNGQVVYTLPDNITENNYKLLIQKQSGAGIIPVKVHLKTNSGDFDQEGSLTKDLKFEFQKK